MNEKELEKMILTLQKEYKKLGLMLDYMLERLMVLARINQMKFEDPREPIKPKTVIR